MQPKRLPGLGFYGSDLRLLCVEVRARACGAAWDGCPLGCPILPDHSMPVAFEHPPAAPRDGRRAQRYRYM